MGTSKEVTLNRTLSLPLVVLYGLSFMAPGVTLTVYGAVTEITHGAAAGGYIMMLIIMLFTVSSYAKMVKAYPRAGSAYTYTQKSISPHFGFLVGWTILLDYYFTPVFNAVILGVYLSSAFPAVPNAVWVIAFIIIITAINIWGVKFSSRVGMWLVLFQFLVVVLFAALSIKGVLNGEGTGTLFSIAPFFNANSDLSSVFSAIPLLYLGFLGFDFVTTLSEETYRPKKTLPKAMFIIAIIGGFLGITLSYIANMIHPDLSSFADIDSAAYEIAIEIGGNLFGAVFIAGAIVAACSTSSAASYASASRILYAMGRENVLPKKFFGHLSPKFRTPTYNIVLIGTCTLLAVFIDLDTAASFISFGVSVGFTFVNLSVIFHYFIKKKRRSLKETINYLIVPLIGACFTAYIFYSLNIVALIVGLSWVVLGFIYLLFLTKAFRQAPPELHFEEDEASTM